MKMTKRQNYESEMVRNKVLQEPILFSDERNFQLNFLRNHLAKDFVVAVMQFKKEK